MSFDLQRVNGTPDNFFKSPPRTCGHQDVSCDERPRFAIDWTVTRETCNWVRHYVCTRHADATKDVLPFVLPDVFYRIGRLVFPRESDEVDVAVEAWIFQLGRYVAWARDGYPIDDAHVRRQRMWEAA